MIALQSIDVARKPSLLQQEIRQRRPFASVRQEAFIGLLRTADVLRRLVSAVVAPRGLTAQQYNVLRILRGAGPEGLPTLEIADRMIEQAPGITRLLDRLEAKAWASRKRCPEDRRQVLCTITGEGLKLLASLDVPVRRLDRQALGMLRLPDVETMIRSLDRVRAGQKAENPKQGED